MYEITMLSMTRPELHTLMVTYIIIPEKVTPYSAILQGNIVSIPKHVITTSLINKCPKRV
jgi:hypothetical protein